MWLNPNNSFWGRFSFSLSSLSIEFYIALLVSFMIYTHSLYSSKETESYILSQIVDSQEILLQRIEDYTDLYDYRDFYVVKRYVNVRIRPTTKSKVMTILNPNQKVRLIKRKGKWIFIEYFDHVNEIHVTGWCYKKYLKQLKKI